MLSICLNTRTKSWRNQNRFVVNKCNWEGINFPSEKNDWKNFDKNNVTIAPNALYVKKEKAYSEDITQIEKRKLFF